MRVVIPKSATDDLLQVMTRIADGIDDLRQQFRGLAANGVNAKTAATVEEAAQLLACSRTTVFHLLKLGRLKRAQAPGRATLVTTESIQTALVAAPPKLRRRSEPAGAPWKPVNRLKLGV